MRIVFMSGEQLANLLSWHERCNAYCAGDRHAEVIWVACDDDAYSESTALINDLAVELGQTLGVAYDGHEPAPEARPRETLMVSKVVRDERGIATVMPVEDVPAELEQTAYLVRFRCPLPLDTLRQALGVGR